jgi:hypothetical protein
MTASSVAGYSRTAVDRYTTAALVEGDAEAVDQFVARVLHRAHEAAEARNAPSEARAILDVAQMFADELIAGDPGFDRFSFVVAATEGPS